MLCYFNWIFRVLTRRGREEMIKIPVVRMEEDNTGCQPAERIGCYMIGTLCGDYIGSVYEWHNHKSKQFELFSRDCRFTDDSVMTIATMDALLNDLDFGLCYRKWYRKYPDAGYGGSFRAWAADDDSLPYNSWGNGSAMRVSPVGCFYDSLEQVLAKALESAAVSHNHPEGIKGAQATAACVYWALHGESQASIRRLVAQSFGYDLNFSLDGIRETYQFDVSCQGSVPQAIVAFLESSDYEDAVRNAISIGGDSDTIAAIAGGIAEAFYKVIPHYIKKTVMSSLPDEFREVIALFYARCGWEYIFP